MSNKKGNEEMKNQVIAILIASMLAGAGTWVWTMANMVSKKEIEHFVPRKEISRMIEIESPYGGDKKEIYLKLDTIIEDLKDIKTKIESN